MVASKTQADIVATFGVGYGKWRHDHGMGKVIFKSAIWRQCSITLTKVYKYYRYPSIHVLAHH